MTDLVFSSSTWLPQAQLDFPISTDNCRGGIVLFSNIDMNAYQFHLLCSLLVQWKSIHLNILRHKNAPLTMAKYLKCEKGYIYREKINKEDIYIYLLCIQDIYIYQLYIHIYQLYIHIYMYLLYVYICIYIYSRQMYNRNYLKCISIQLI